MGVPQDENSLSRELIHVAWPVLSAGICTNDDEIGALGGGKVSTRLLKVVLPRGSVDGTKVAPGSYSWIIRAANDLMIREVNGWKIVFGSMG